MDKTGIEKRVLEEDVNELEREKVMLEYELDNAGAKHKADLRNLEIQLASAKDNESDLMQRIDLMNKVEHITLEQNLTIRSRDHGKEGHFCNCGETSIHLPLTRGTQLPGNYPLNKFTP